MHTSLLLVVMASSVNWIDGFSEPPWQPSYAQARKVVASQKKPMAVILAPGKEGWRSIAHQGVPPEASQLLRREYVCLHIDTSTDKGKELAKSFNLTNGKGLVISDRTGELQAFRHDGDLPSDALTTYLKRYSAPNWVVTSTDTHQTSRISNYPPVSSQGRSTSPPQGSYYYPSGPACRT